MAHNTITCNGKTYTDKDIESATGYRKSPIIGDELPYDTFKAEIWDYGSNLTALPYGSPVTWTRNGKIVLAQFLASVQRTGKYKYLLSCVSGIGLLAQIKHYGGLYENVPFSTILADIVGGTFPYTVDSSIASIAVYGWLPVDNRRGNLRRLLTATGAVVRANADGSVRFASPNTASPSQIKDQDIYMGGTVDYPTRYQAVKITEHAYSITQNDILTTLLDGEAAGGSIVTPKGKNVTGALITFSDPMHDLSVEGSEILESGVNYAVLSPSGSCMLTGYKYSHTTHIVTAGSLENSEKATKRLDDCTLIGIFNSSIVAKRWLDFYSSQKIVKISTVWNGEQPSDAVTFLDPYDNQDIGLIESQDVRLSAKVAADIEVQVGTIPPVFEYRNSRKIYTSNGSFTVPEGVTHIRAVLIGGAYGGATGNPGETGGVGEKFTYTNSVSGKRTYWRTLGRGGKGGSGGNGGQAGKVLVVDIDTTPGQVITFNIGTGGAANSAGTATTFGAHSSADGSVLPDGYVDPVTGDVYATAGDVGLPGGDGNGWAGGDLNRTNALNIAQGAPVGGYGPGENSLETASEPGYYVYYYIMSGGGARNQNGSINGGSISKKLSECKGGKGADATYIPDKPSVPGKGGTGGSGGGGGGGAAAQEMLSSTDATAQGGDGGLGSIGGIGADGALILYYAEPVSVSE